MNGKRIGSLFALAAVFVIPFPAHAYQIAPNPNNGTIIVSEPDANNGESPFVNNGVVEIDGTGSLTNGASTMTNNGTLNNSGTLDNLNSTLSNSGTLDNSGSLTNGGSTMTNTGTLNNSGVMFNGEATVNNYGTVNNTGELENGDATVNNSGTMNNLGAMSFDIGGIDNTGTLNNTGRLIVSDLPTSLVNSGTLNNSGVITISDISSLNNSGMLSNTGTLVNNSIYQGAYNSGTLSNHGMIGGTGSYMQTAGTTINDGGMTQTSVNIQGGSLSGNGTITGNVNIGSAATLSPGDPVGTLTINGQVISGGNLLFQIGGLSSGQFSVLDINGNAVFNGGVIDFNFINGFNPAAGEYWDFLNATSIDWNAVSFQLSGLGNGLGWGLDLTGNEATLSIIANSVPEPSSFTLLGTGLAGLMFLVRRYRHGQPG